MAQSETQCKDLHFELDKECTSRTVLPVATREPKIWIHSRTLQTTLNTTNEYVRTAVHCRGFCSDEAKDNRNSIFWIQLPRPCLIKLRDSLFITVQPRWFFTRVQVSRLLSRRGKSSGKKCTVFASKGITLKRSFCCCYERRFLSNECFDLPEFIYPQGLGKKTKLRSYLIFLC